MIELRGLHLGNIARSPAESVRPDLWPDHAWVPALGCTGGVLYDLCGGKHGSVTGYASWGHIEGGVALVSPLFVVGRVPVVISGGGAPWGSQGSIFLSLHHTTPTNYASPIGWDGYSGIVLHSTGSIRTYRENNHTNLDWNDRGVPAGAHDLAIVRYGELPWEAWIDGIVDTDPDTPIGTFDVQITKLLGGYRSFVGAIYCATIYSARPLTPGQVLDLHSDPILPFRRRQPVYYSVPSGGGSARSLIAALAGASATGTISAIIARALTGDVAATSITGAITASMARDLLASLQGQSTTGDIAATLQRLLLASLGTASTTGDVATTTARALLAGLQASSTTPDIAATLAALVALIANISGTTTTPAVAATMARALAANLAGQSTTGAIAVEFAGMLLLVASIAGTSTTGALTATTGRELRAAIATASTTGQVDRQLLRQIAATIAGTSLTGSIAAELVNLVSLAASVVGVSLTPAVAATLSRDLAAEVAAGSTTGAASATVARTLTAAVEAGSLTPDNLVLILTGLGILHDTTIISRTPRRGITSRTVRRTIHSA